MRTAGRAGAFGAGQAYCPRFGARGFGFSGRPNDRALPVRRRSRWRGDLGPAESPRPSASAALRPARSPRRALRWSDFRETRTKTVVYPKGIRAAGGDHRASEDIAQET